MVRNPYLPDKPRASPGKPEYWSSKPPFELDWYRKIGCAKVFGRWDMLTSDHPVEDEAMYNSDESYRFAFVVNGKPIYVNAACWDSMVIYERNVKGGLFGLRDLQGSI